MVILTKEYTFYHFFELGKNYEKANEYIFITFSNSLKLTEKAKLLSTLLSLFWTRKKLRKSEILEFSFKPFFRLSKHEKIAEYLTIRTS